jgi:hypothetical protein
MWDSRHYLCPVVITKWLCRSVIRGVASIHPRNLLSQLRRLPALVQYLIQCRLACAFYIVFVCQIVLSGILDFALWLAAYNIDTDEIFARHPLIGRGISLSQIGVAWYLAADPMGQFQSGSCAIWNALVYCATACGVLKLWSLCVQCSALSVQAIASVCVAA